MKTENAKIVDVAVRLSRCTRSSGPDFFRLTVSDVTAALVIIAAEIPLGEIANLIGSREAVGTAEVFVNANVGRVMEVKSVEIVLGGAGSGPIAPGVWAAAEVDADREFGRVPNSRWIPDREKEYNHHRVRREGNRTTYTVTVRRWVDRAPDKEA